MSHPAHNTAQAQHTGTGEYHRPVMVAEVLAALAPGINRTIVDATLGGGGHTKAILGTGAKIVGIDQDMGAIGYCIPQLVVYDGDSVRLSQANFRQLEDVLNQLKIDKVDGILLDIGVSSRQLDLAERGFSFQKAGPLDMRMDRRATVSAETIVNAASHEDLTLILRRLGEEPAAARIASAIIKQREAQPISNTLELARVIEDVVPKRGPRHPATRSFQALRMEVNDELGALQDALEAAARRLKPGGRLVVITFHSLEDRIVKNFCRETSNPTVDRPEWPSPKPNPRYMFRSVTKKAVQSSPEETVRNPRARSAKLRALERTTSPFSYRSQNQATPSQRSSFKF